MMRFSGTCRLAFSSFVRRSEVQKSFWSQKGIVSIAHYGSGAASFSTNPIASCVNPFWSSLLGQFVRRVSPFHQQQRLVSTKQRRKWKVRKYHFKLRLKRTMRKMRVPYVSSKPRGQLKKKPILYDFRPYLRRKLKRAER